MTTHSNGTYYYEVERLFDNLKYFLVNKTIPLDNIKEACFVVNKEQCNNEDSAFIRALNDTSNESNAKSKIDFLEFTKHNLGQNSKGYLIVVTFSFFDSISFQLYKEELFRFPSSNASHLFANENGLEYLLSPEIIGGLTEKPFKGNSPSIPDKIFKLYIYCAVDELGTLTNFSDRFN